MNIDTSVYGSSLYRAATVGKVLVLQTAHRTAPDYYNY